nr:hypothetical protein [Tanacetum cinerariifolium]
MSNHEEETINEENGHPKVVPQITTVIDISAKFPYLKKGEYDIWAMKMQNFISSSNLFCWNIVLKGNSAISMITDKDGNLNIRPPVTTEEHQQEGLDKGYDKMQKILTQMNILKIKPDPEDVNMKFLRGLPPSWSGYSSSSSTLSNAAFVSTTGSSQGNLSSRIVGHTTTFSVSPGSSSSKGSSKSKSSVVDDVIYSFFTNHEIDQHLVYEDLDQMNKEEFEEYDLKHQMSMLSIKVHRFEKKHGRKIKFNGRENASNNYQKYKSKEAGKDRTDSKAMVVVDGSIDWDKQTEEGNTKPRSLENFGMIAGIKIESDADSEGEVVSADDIPAGDSVSTGDVAATVAAQEKQELMSKLENEIANQAKWNNSGRNLYKLIDSSMSVRTKRGLGLDKYIGEGELGIDDSKVSIFHTNSDDLEGQPVYNRFASVDHMKAVPPPLTWNYMPPSNIPDIDESQMVYGKKATDSSKIKTNDDSITHSNDSVLFDFSDRSLEPSTNVLQTCDSSVECSRSNHNDHDSIDSLFSVSTPASESRDTIVIDFNRQEDFTSVYTSSIETDVKSSKTLCNKFRSFNKESHFRKHKYVASKSYYVCGSYLHLIKDCDLHEQRFAKRNAEGKGILKSRPTGKPVNPNRPKPVSDGCPKPVFGGRPNPVFADQPNPVSAGQPNTVFAGDGILGPRTLNIQPKSTYFYSFTHNNQQIIFPITHNLLYSLYLTSGLNRKTAVKPSADPSQRWLRSLRKTNFSLLFVVVHDNSLSLNELALKGPLTCLIAKASHDESTIWHRRLGHVNFRNMNKLGTGTGQAWMFDIDYLTNSLNYYRVSSTNLTAGSQGATPSNAGSQEDASDSDNEPDVLIIQSTPTPVVPIVNETTTQNDVLLNCLRVLLLFLLIDIPVLLVIESASSELFPRASSVENSDIHDGLKIFDCLKSGIFTFSSYDEDFSGPEANNFESSLNRRNNHIDFQLCMFSCFLSQKEPTTVAQALADPYWVEAMQEPSYNQNYDGDYYLQDLPSFSCCDNYGGSYETFQCQPITFQIDFSGSDQIQTPQYPEIHLSSQETSDKVFQANHSIQSEESFENSSNVIAVSNSNQEKEEPAQESDIHQLIKECSTEVSEKQKMEDTMLELVKIYQEKEFICIHDNVDDLIESALHSKLLLINSNSQHLDKKDLTPEMESDEVIESNAKNLLPIPSECEVTLEDKRECDLPIYENSPICDNHYDTFSDSNIDDDILVYDDDFEDIEYVEASLPDPKIASVEEENGIEAENVVQQEEEEIDLEDISQIQDVVLRKKLLSITHLISNIESLNENSTPGRVLNSFESDNSLLDNFSPEFETFCDHTEETRSGNTTHANYSLPEYDSFCLEIEPDQERLINLVKNDIPDDSSNDPLLEEADLFLASDNSIPTGIENIADDPEGDIHFLEELLIDDSILSHVSSDSNFEDNPLIPRPPPEPPDVETDTGEEIPVVMNKKDEDVDYSSFILVIFAKVFSLLSVESEDTIFDPGLQVDQRLDGIFIHQEKEKNVPDEPISVHLYRSMIGCLMNLTATRQDIMFAVCVAARHQVTPKTSNLLSIKRIFKYLTAYPKLDLWYPRDSPFYLEAFSDSDYAGTHGDWKSTTGGCQFLGRRLISWQCKKQTIVATSSCKAEYVVVASCCGEEWFLLTSAGRVTFCWYALTANPTINASVVKKFWGSASEVSLPDGVKGLVATIVGTAYTVTEASIRSALQLDDLNAIDTMTNEEIFSGLCDIGVVLGTNWLGPDMPLLAHMLNQEEPAFVQAQQQEVSLPLPSLVVASHPSPDPMPSPPRQSSPPPIPYVLETITSPIRDDDTGGGSFHESPPRPPPATLPRSPTRIATLEAELKATKILYRDIVVLFAKRIKKLEIKLKTKKRKLVLSDSENEEEARQSQELDALLHSANAALHDPSDTTTPSKPDNQEQSSEQEINFTDAAIPAAGLDSAGGVVSAGGAASTSGLTSIGISVAAGPTVFAEPSSPIRDPAKGKAVATPSPVTDPTDKELADQQATILEAERQEPLEKELKQSLNAEQVYLDNLLAQRVAEEHERESKASAAQMVELMNQRRKAIAEMKAKAKRNKPMTPAQQKEFMRTFVKNQSSAIYTTGWTWKDVRGLTDDQLQNIYDTICRAVDLATDKDHHQHLKRSELQELTSVSGGAPILAVTLILVVTSIPVVTSVPTGSFIPAVTPSAAGVSTTAGASGSVTNASILIIELLDSPPKDTSIPLDPKTEEQDETLRKPSRKKSIARRRSLPSAYKPKSDALLFDEDDPEVEFKRYLRQASDDDEPVEPVSLALVSDITSWEIIPTQFGLGEIHVLTRADGTVKRFSTLRELMYWADRADLIVLY